MYTLFDVTNWRYERKFIVSELSKYELESIVRLHPAMFSEIYHERSVNNIYFDTFRFDNYMDNEVGTSKRLKVRIRWYGGLFGTIEKPVLEVKIKDGFLGSKISYPLKPITVSSTLNIDYIQSIFKKSSGIPELIKLNLADLNFTLLNCYKRKYFQSADRKYRITIDFDLQFYKVKNDYNFFMHKYIDNFGSIVELKYDQKEDKAAANIASHFPFRITKSSKYVSGLQYLTV